MKTRGRGNAVNRPLVLLAALAMLCSAVVVEAAGIRLEASPTLRLDEGWYSNVNNTGTEEISSFGTRVVPGLDLALSSPDNVTITLSGNYEKVWYHDSEAKESDYDTWYFRIESSGGWKLTPTLSMLPTVFYVNTTDSYRRAQLVPSSDPLVQPSSITNYGETETRDIGGGLSFDYQIAPTLTLGISGTYGEQKFKDPDAVDADLTDSTSTGGGASISYLVSPRTKIGVAGSWSHVSYDENPDSDTYAGSLTYSYLLSEAFQIELSAGVSHARQESYAGGESAKDTSPTGSVNLLYTDQTFSANLFGSYVYTGGSGYGEVTRQGTVSIMLTDHFTREWTWTLTGSYQISKSAYTEDAIDINTIYGNAAIRYQVSKWASLELSGNASHQESDGEFGSSLENYSAVLGFIISKPFILF